MNTYYKFLKKFWQLLLVLSITTSAMCYADAQNDLQKALKANRKKIANLPAIQLVYVEDITNQSLTAQGDPNSVDYKIAQSRKKRLNKVEALIDHKNNRTKLVRTDLRDVNAIMDKYNLPSEEKANVSNSETFVTQGSYEMTVQSVGQPPASAGLFEHPRKMSYPKPYFGLIDNGLFEYYNKNQSFNLVTTGSIPLLRMTADHNSLPKSVKILCGPELNYRFYNMETYRNGMIHKEIVADDYRDVNGIPYPFSYTERQFDENGKVVKEKRYTFEKVDFGIDVTDEDFKVFIPEGSSVSDTILSMRAFNLKPEQSGKKMSIGDILEVTAQID